MCPLGYVSNHNDVPTCVVSHTRSLCLELCQGSECYGAGFLPPLNWVHFQDDACGIYGGRRGTGVGVSIIHSFFLCQSTFLKYPIIKCHRRPLNYAHFLRQHQGSLNPSPPSFCIVVNWPLKCTE